MFQVISAFQKTIMTKIILEKRWCIKKISSVQVTFFYNHDFQINAAVANMTGLSDISIFSITFTFFLLGFSFTNIQDSQDSRGRGMLSPSLTFNYHFNCFTTTSTRFTDT